MTFNKLLSRQIRKTFGGIENVPEEMLPFMDMVNRSYKHFERDHQLIERSMEISSEELKQVHLDIERRNQLLEEYAYVIAHDLKTPIRSIVSFNQILLKRHSEDLNDEAKNLMNYAINASIQMSKLLDGLLEFSVVNKGKHKFEILDLNKIIQEVCNYIELNIKSNHAQIIVGKLPEIKGVRTLIFQLFLNLINNSIKYKSEENPIIEISHHKNKNDKNIFCVKDNGIGIANEHHEKVFQIFNRLSSNKNLKGTGIGLSLCKKIVEKHQGRIWIVTDSIKGTEFKFTLKV